MSYRYLLGTSEVESDLRWMDAISPSGVELRAKLTEQRPSGPFKLFIDDGTEWNEIEAFFSDPSGLVWPACDDFWLIDMDNHFRLHHPSMDELRSAYENSHG